MSDDHNPYRFSGDVGDLRAAEPDDRDLTPRDLKAIDVGRRALFVLIAFSTATLLVTMTLWPLSLSIVGPWWPTINALAPVAGLLCALTYPLLFLSGLQLTPHLHRRFGAFHALGLVVPCVNVFVAGAILQDATRTLLDRGVRPGWLVSDFRDARHIPAEER